MPMLSAGIGAVRLMFLPYIDVAHMNDNADCLRLSHHAER